MILLFLLFLSTSFASDCVHTNSSFKCVEYVKNYDADTVTFNIKNVHPIIGQKISIRVKHLDTPEIKGKMPCEKETARNARNLVEKMLKNAKRIDLLNVEKDKYFRLLADVSIDGKDLGSILLKNNLAYQYEGQTKQKLNWCRRGVAGQK